jgi:CubicO group peptidase (beta-lactamase class C family)
MPRNDLFPLFIMMRSNLSTLFLLFLVATAFSVQAQEAKLPDTPAGRRVAAYLKAFNSGDAALMREFQNNNLTAATLQRRTEAERQKMYQEIYGNLGSLELKRIIEATNDAITVLFLTKTQMWATLSFEFEAQLPHKIAGMGFEVDSNPPPAAESVSSKPTTDTELISTASNYLDQQVQADEFSGVVLLAKNGKPIFHKAYGLANKTYNAPNQLDTKFNLGSINKIFTKIAIAQLAEQGKLTFDDPIGKHLPDYPNRDAAAKVTIQHLLNMSSGIGDFFNEKYENTPKNKIRGIKDYLPLFANDPLEFEPGTKRRYSNGGYIVLGAIIEALSGQDYYTHVREHIFKPAGMENSDSYELDALAPNIATGYTRRASADGREAAVRRSNIYTAPARGSSAGGGYSNAEDLLKFTLALQNGKLLNSEYSAWIFAGRDAAPPSRTNGKATSTKITGGGLGIAGGAPGINAILEMDIASGYTIIVLSNYDPPSAERVGRQIRSWLPRQNN